MDELELILWLFLAIGSAGVIAAFLFYGGAFLIQRIKLLWLELEARRVEVIAQRATVKMALDQNDLQTQVINLDVNGLPPVSRKMIDSGLTTQAAFQIALAYIDAQRTHAPTPTHLTYAPHIKGSDAHQVEPAGLLEAPLFKVADFFQLYQSDQLPKDKFLLGYDLTDHQPVYVTWLQLYSALIGGQSGSGKSTLIRNILAQSALQGGRFAILDPHYLAGEESLGASLMPLRSRMLFDVAADDQAMLQALKFIMDVGQTRIAGRDADRTPVVLVVDETTALLSRGKIANQLIDVLAMIAQEGRKVHVFALCIGQNFSAEVMPTSARNSFVSQISCKARRDVARTQSGNALFGRLVETLNKGQCVAMLPGDEMRALAVPNCTQRHLEAIGTTLSAQKDSAGVWSATGENTGSNRVQNGFKSPNILPEFEPDLNPSGTQNDVILDAKAQRAIAMFASGKSMAEIIAEVWNITKSGGAYQRANTELQAILRRQLGGAR